MFSFALAACLAGIAGVLWAMLHNLSPFTGQAIIITLFAVVVLGGSGEHNWGLSGRYSAGPGGGSYCPLFHAPAFTVCRLCCLDRMLLLRPRGLMGASVEAE